MKVVEYIDQFLLDHQMRFKPHDWPLADTEEWEQYRRLWVSAFIDMRVKLPEADTASVRCGPNPPKFRSDHLPRIINEIEAIRLANQINNVPDDRELAARDSKECDHCDGSGYRLVYHPKYDGREAIETKRNGKLIREPARVLATCQCPLGLYLRAQLEPSDKWRYPEVRKILDGQSRWLYANPTEELSEDRPKTMGELMAQINRVVICVAVRPNPKNARRERESWLVRWLAHMLRGAEVPWSNIVETAEHQGRTDLNEIRDAGELLRVKIEHRNGKEFWSLLGDAISE